MCRQEGLALSTPPACTMLPMGGSQHKAPPPLSSALASALQETSHMASLTHPCTQTLCYLITNDDTGTVQFT